MQGPSDFFDNFMLDKHASLYISHVFSYVLPSLAHSGLGGSSHLSMQSHTGSSLNPSTHSLPSPQYTFAHRSYAGSRIQKDGKVNGII